MDVPIILVVFDEQIGMSHYLDTEWVKRTASQIAGGTSAIAKIRLAGGVVGKVATVLIFLCFAFASAVFCVPRLEFALVGFILLLGTILWLCLRCVRLAEKNPAACISMEQSCCCIAK